MHEGFWKGNLKERVHLEDPGVGERMILTPTMEKQNGGIWTGLIGSG
jgi:hypothetical protein